ncbi:MAG: hypothetical protein WCT07_04510 [Candidatus Paceibacterota bacterium]
MALSLDSGEVKFKCACGVVLNGDPSDVEIDNEVFTDNKQYGWNNIIRLAPFDITQKVNKKCEGCGLNYMSRVIIGSEQDIIYVCKCGHREIMGVGS